jgi:hypothetical protein
MIFIVGGQRKAQGTVDRCGDSVPPGSKRGRTGGKRKRGVTRDPGIELEKYEPGPPKIVQGRLTEILVWTTGESSRRIDSSTSSTAGGSG